MKKTYKVKTIDGVKYYQCINCGTVGNWKQHIVSRTCCLKTKNTPKGASGNSKQ